MILNVQTIVMTALMARMYCNLALGQQPPPSILTIDVANVVEYQGDISDPTKFASNPGHDSHCWASNRRHHARLAQVPYL
jgi:hypothetical protein